MKVLLGALCLLVVSGCAEKQLNELSYAEMKKIAVDIAAKCRAQGAISRPEFEVCFKQEAMAEDARRRNSVTQAEGAAQAVGAVAGLALVIGSQPGHN